MSLCSSEFDANDFLQETFIKAYINLSKYNSKYPFTVWLHSIAKNVFLDSVRRRATQSSMRLLTGGDIIDIIDESIEHESFNYDLREVVANCINTLAPKYKEILEMRYYIGYDYHEIAAALGLPEGTVKTHLHRAKARLKIQIIKTIENEQRLRVDK